MPVDDRRAPDEDGAWPPPGPLGRRGPARAPGQPRARRLTRWQVAGIVLAVVLAICGLALVAAFVVFAVGMNMWASNK